MMSFMDQISELRAKMRELEETLSSPDVQKDQEKLKRLSREYKELREILDIAERLLQVEEELQSVRELLKEETSQEDRDYLEEEQRKLQTLRENLERDLKKRLVPRDPQFDRNCIVEIRAGTGGEEAALFAADLFKMYRKYAEKKGWKVSVTDIRPTELGGIKEITFIVEGKGAYGYLRYESGVHRVQRVPETESGGRIHTSAATVVVLPEVEDVEVEINPDDLKIETFRAGGPGGQYVNMTDSAVRITHLPTGITVTCQDERSQHKNKEKALRILKSRLYDLKKREQEEKLDRIRRSYIGTGDRSEKIRTYNFPQNRVTDHRIGLSLHNLEEILDGELDPVIEALLEEEERRRLEEIGAI